MNLIKFLKAAGNIGLGSVGLAIVLLVISIDEHLKDKNVSAYVLVLAAALSFAFGAYRAWANDHKAYMDEIEKNTKPLLKIELKASFFDISKVPDKQTLNLLIHIYAYLKVTNLTSPETVIKDGTLEMTVGGTRYQGIGHDKSVKGNAIEHISNFRIGGELTTTDVFGRNTLSPVKRLTSVVNADSPLKRGITQEGFFVYTFTDAAIDWDHENAYVMPVTDLVFTLRDSFDGVHSLEVESLDIPQGIIQTSGTFLAQQH